MVLFRLTLLTFAVSSSMAAPLAHSPSREEQKLQSDAARAGEFHVNFEFEGMSHLSIPLF